VKKGNYKPGYPKLGQDAIIEGELREQIIEEHIAWLKKGISPIDNDVENSPLGRWLSEHEASLAKRRSSNNWYKRTKKSVRAKFPK
jgi:agmatine/peptidylarginine deiminase